MREKAGRLLSNGNAPVVYSLSKSQGVDSSIEIQKKCDLIYFTLYIFGSQHLELPSLVGNRLLQFAGSLRTFKILITKEFKLSMKTTRTASICMSLSVSGSVSVSVYVCLYLQAYIPVYTRTRTRQYKYCCLQMKVAAGNKSCPTSLTDNRQRLPCQLPTVSHTHTHTLAHPHAVRL